MQLKKEELKKDQQEKPSVVGMDIVGDEQEQNRPILSEMNTICSSISHIHMSQDPLTTESSICDQIEQELNDMSM